MDNSKSEGIKVPFPELSVNTGLLKVTAIVLSFSEKVVEMIKGCWFKLKVNSSVLPMVEKSQPVTVPE